MQSFWVELIAFATVNSNEWTLICYSPQSFLIDLTASLQNVWYEDEFVIALSNVRLKKRQSGSTETLLAVKYGDSRTKTVLILDRRTKRGEPKRTLWDFALDFSPRPNSRGAKLSRDA